MSCDELDRLRTGDLRLQSPEWPEAARLHLATCARCARLQALLDRSMDVDYPEVKLRRVEAAILPNLRPVSPLPSVRNIVASLLLCSIAVIVIANARLGVAGWKARSAVQLLVDFSLLSLSVLLLATGIARQMAPGSRRGIPSWLVNLAPLLALFTACLALFQDRGSAQFFPLALSCWEIGVTCAALSAPLFWLILRRGFPLNPVAHGTSVGLLAGLTGLTVLEIYCPYLDRLHISAAHIGAAVTATLAGAAVGALKARRARRPA